LNNSARKTLGTALATAIIAVCLGLPAGASAQTEELALGGESGCVAVSTGGLNCWGRHPAGFYIKGGPFLPALGDELPTPVDIIDGNVTDIAISREQKCAIADGGAFCWGEYAGAPHPNGVRDGTVIPVPVPGFESGVQDISIGGQGGVCFVKSGAVSCWAGGAWPEPLIDSGATSISSSGYDLTCAVVSGQAICWGLGANRAGRDGAADESFSAGVSAGLSAGVESVSVGYDSTCAIVNGGVRCWGKNDQGQLGDGTTTDTTGAESRQVSGLTSGVTAISVGNKVACAVVSGAAKCWGSNNGGLYGDGSLDTDYESGLPSTPVTVSGLDSGVDAVAVQTNWNACARQSGAVKCWGRGALGSQVTSKVATPTAVVGGSGITNLRLDAGMSAVCGIENGAAKCWGGSGHESQTQGAFPRPLGAPFESGVSTIYPRSCGIVNGALECGEGGVQASEGMESDIVALAVSSYDSCASTASLVRCWYVSSSGYGGTHYAVRTVEHVGSSITQLSVGQTHSCAIASGAARCWGRNGYGQLGVSSPEYSYEPVTPTGLSDGVTSIAASEEFSCAAVNGSAKCWGLGNSYRLGNGTDQTQFEPRQIAGLDTGVKSVAAGSAHACALMYSGAIYCWGDNYSGQLGNGSFENSTAPVLVTGVGSGATELAAGGATTCARIDGVAKCWGSNLSGMLGIGTIDWHLTPVAQGPTAPKPPLAVVRSPGWNHRYDVNTIPVDTFSNVEGERECSLDDQPFSECPETLTNVSEGPHVYRVKVTYEGNKSVVGENPFNVDAFDPVITLHNLEDDLTANAGVRRFASFTVSEPAGWFYCKVDDWVEVTCNPNTDYDLWFWPGTHTVTIRQGGGFNGVAVTKTFQIGGAEDVAADPAPAPQVNSLSTRAESALSLKLRSRGSYAKGTRKLIAQVRLANTDLQPGTSCSGSVVISAPGLNAAERHSKFKLDAKRHCVASRTFSIKRAFKRKRIGVTAVYAGNSLFLPKTISGKKHL
jgi:alpha-tubulin suppressor-like RCC1 family protein